MCHLPTACAALAGAGDTCRQVSLMNPSVVDGDADHARWRSAGARQTSEGYGSETRRAVLQKYKGMRTRLPLPFCFYLSTASVYSEHSRFGTVPIQSAPRDPS